MGALSRLSTIARVIVDLRYTGHLVTRTIFDVVDSLKGKFQVITDHPDFSDDARFKNAVRERWRDGLKLVPDDWPRDPTQ